MENRLASLKTEFEKGQEELNRLEHRRQEVYAHHAPHQRRHPGAGRDAAGRYGTTGGFIKTLPNPAQHEQFTPSIGSPHAHPPVERTYRVPEGAPSRMPTATGSMS